MNFSTFLVVMTMITRVCKRVFRFRIRTVPVNLKPDLIRCIHGMVSNIPCCRVGMKKKIWCMVLLRDLPCFFQRITQQDFHRILLVWVKECFCLCCFICSMNIEVGLHFSRFRKARVVPESPISLRVGCFWRFLFPKMKWGMTA